MKTQIEVGQKVTVIFPWREDEHPTANNFYTGEVTQVIEKSLYSIYVRVSGLENVVPVDRVCNS